MVKNNRTCIICNKPYRYCGNCQGDAGKPSWYLIFHGQNCYDVYETCVAYRDEVINKKEAYDRISKLDLSDLDNFAEATRLQIKDILCYKEVEKPMAENVKVESFSKTNNTKNNINKK